MKKREITLPILVALSASLAVVADDFKTIDGKEYKDAKVSRIEPDGHRVDNQMGNLKTLLHRIA